MTERTQRFEISADLNRVELNVSGYTLALNAGDVYETADVAELDALASNPHVQPSSKPASRSYQPFEAPAEDPALFGAPPSAYVAPLSDKELAKARKSDSGGNAGGGES